MSTDPFKNRREFLKSIQGKSDEDVAKIIFSAFNNPEAQVIAWDERRPNGDTFISVGGQRVAYYYTPFYAVNRIWRACDARTNGRIGGIFTTEHEARSFCEEYAREASNG